MYSKTYIGVDPGSVGFIAVEFGDGGKEFLPLKDNGWQDVCAFLGKIQNENDCVCCMEEIHAVFGSSAGATFSFGETYGVLQGTLIALGIPFHLVPPKIWQREMWTSSDKVYKTGKDKNGRPIRRVDNKATSINAARRLFPDVDFRRTAKCKTVDDNKCDAMLICDYGRRKNL